MHININIGVGTRGEGDLFSANIKSVGRGLKFNFFYHYMGIHQLRHLLIWVPSMLLYWKGNSTFILVIIKLCDMLNILNHMVKGVV